MGNAQEKWPLVVNSLMGTPPIEATSWWQAMMRWMGLIVAPEQTDALLCHRSSGKGNGRLWKVGTIWIFRSCRGVGDRRTSYRSVGGRRFSDGALNSDSS